MSTITLPPPLVASASAPYRMTADEFDRIAEGLDKRAELVDGHLVERPDMNPEHAMVTKLLRRFLDRILGDDWHACEEKPIRQAASARRPASDPGRGDRHGAERGRAHRRRVGGPGPCSIDAGPGRCQPAVRRPGLADAVTAAMFATAGTAGARTRRGRADAR